jgi:rhamnulokinase
MPKTLHHKPYLAFDLGAESGRAILGYFQSGILTTKEVHRFPNEPIEYRGSLRWDVAKLWSEMRKALAQVEEVELGGIGVDTWGVDYALLGEKGELLENPYHYRDRRTEGVLEEVLRKVSRQEIYQATGIQFMPINTLYQLFAARREDPNIFTAAKKMITMPDLFHYWMTGNAVCEFTNETHLGDWIDAALGDTGRSAGSHCRTRDYDWDTLAKHCRTVFTRWHPSDRSSVS